MLFILFPYKVIVSFFNFGYNVPHQGQRFKLYWGGITLNILILSCFTGEGHNSAAHAVEEALLKYGAECELVDPVSFQSKRAQNFVSGFYNGMIKKTPKAFGALYKAGALYSATDITSPVYLANAHYAETLYKYITDKQFDAVISTHLYGMEVMTAIHKRLNASIPSYGVMTDYTCIPFFTETLLDGYFVPACGVKTQLAQKNVPEERIWETGIPVSAKFNQHISKMEAREVLSIAQEEKVYLIMTGGVGCENMVSLCDEILSTAQDHSKILVMTGRNDHLNEKLRERYGETSPVRAIGFTEKVNLYMNASDVMISKPGGLSSTEAAVANIPLVHYNAIPGCETQNATFFAEHGLSCWAKSKQEAATYAKELAYDTQRSERMRTMQRQLINPDAANDIVRYVLSQ